jgi:hypothetical protein
VGFIKKVAPTERIVGWTLREFLNGASDDGREGAHSGTEADSSEYKAGLEFPKNKPSKIAIEEPVQCFPSTEEYTTRELGYEIELIFLIGHRISCMHSCL